MENERRNRQHFPPGLTTPTDDTVRPITLCTLGSVHRAFDRGDKSTTEPYNLVIVDESSQAAESDMFPLLSYLLQVATRTRTFPPIILLGDPMQLGPVVRGSQDGTILGMISKMSMFERMTPTASMFLHGRNCLPTVKLNVQYRMPRVINDMANRLCGRTVRSRALHRQWLGGRTATENLSYFIANIMQLTQAHLNHRALWIDPYEDETNGGEALLHTITTFIDPNAPVNEYSCLEVAAVVRVIQLYFQYRDFNVRDMLLLSSYNAQCQLLRRSLQNIFGRVFPNTPEGRRLLDRTVSTVYGSQGAESNLVIYCPGKDPANNDVFGEGSLMDNPRQLYVQSTRAREHFVICAPWRLFHNNIRSWHPITMQFDFV